VRNLDLVTFLFIYHETTYMPVDRAKMNKKLFAALKPGGFLVIADHSASAGAGTAVGRSLHRIEESVVRSEVEAAGFKLVGEGDFWRHPEDTHDFITQPPDQAGGRVRSQVSETAAKRNVAARSGKASRATFLWRVPATGLN
jgi:predicted methyltransferase